MNLIERTHDVAKKHWNTWSGIVADLKALPEDDELFQNDDEYSTRMLRFLREAKHKHMGPEEFQRLQARRMYTCYLCEFCHDLTADIDGINMCQICPLGNFHMRLEKTGCGRRRSPYHKLFEVTTKEAKVKYAEKVWNSTFAVAHESIRPVRRFKQRVLSHVKDVPQALRDKFTWDEVVTLICFAKQIPLSYIDKETNTSKLFEPADFYL